jgi:hypothetical protein
VNQQQGRLADAVHDFRQALDSRTPEMVRRKFDFSRDYEVRNSLGIALFDQARQIRGTAQKTERDALLKEAAAEFDKTLAIDSENMTAHYNLNQIFVQLGDPAKAAEHLALHAKFKVDDNAADLAVRLAREKYPAANHAAEKLVIYSLHRGDESAPSAAGGEPVPTTAGGE